MAIITFTLQLPDLNFSHKQHFFLKYHNRKEVLETRVETLAVSAQFPQLISCHRFDVDKYSAPRKENLFSHNSRFWYIYGYVPGKLGERGKILNRGVQQQFGLN